MNQGTGRLRRSDRLLSSRDFQRVTRRGRRFASGEFVILVTKSSQRPSRHPQGPSLDAADRHAATLRLGITASRKVGNAVTRNRLKRGIREWFRIWRKALEPGTDWVIITRPPAAALRGRAIEASLCELMGIGPDCGDRVR